MTAGWQVVANGGGRRPTPLLRDGGTDETPARRERVPEPSWTPDGDALAWCLNNPNVSTAITGASRVEQLVEYLGTMDLLAKVDDAVMEKIEAVLDNRPSLPDGFR